jgi:steroid delta-isomerase-like uncharacterized protein
MSTTQATSNKEAFRRLIDVVNTGDAELVSNTIDEVIATDARIPTPVPDATGAEAIKELFRRLRQAFPDLHITIEDMIAEGDKVVCRDTVTRTHKGDFMGLPPTGRSIAYDEIFIARFVDGRVVEAWGVVDVMSQMRQLGVVPAGL